jgi:hypothetical protein
MNWLGKVFVVVILIMSLVFMGLSMAVYATHKNWKQFSDNLNRQLEQARAEKDQLVTAHNRRVEELDREKTAFEQQAIKLEAERVSLDDRNKQIQAELDTLKQNQRDHIAAVAATQEINKTLNGEVASLRTQVRTEQQNRDKAFKAALVATEQLHQTTGELEVAKEREQQLTKQNVSMRTNLRENNLNPDMEPGQIVPAVEGVVSRVEQRAGTQLVEVTIGADDGLKTGNTLEVSRGSKYLGRLDIIETSPDKSVGRVDRRYLQGKIQEGDRVATRIRL